MSKKNGFRCAVVCFCFDFVTVQPCVRAVWEEFCLFRVAICGEYVANLKLREPRERGLI